MVHNKCLLQIANYLQAKRIPRTIRSQQKPPIKAAIIHHAQYKIEAAIIDSNEILLIM
jgi:hypothetical protein